MTDSQMFAHKMLLIPLPGRPMPSSVRLNGSGQKMKRYAFPLFFLSLIHPVMQEIKTGLHLNLNADILKMKPLPYKCLP